jgi:hypothetical protein
VPLVAVGLATELAFGPVTPVTQIVTIVLGGVPMLFFLARHSRRWRPPANDGSSKA